MRYSANLNIIVKAIENATARMSRDFLELENLQTNSLSANKFANSCYTRCKQVLADEFTRLRPDYDIIFSDGEKALCGKNSEYAFVVFPIDGIDNLSRANPDFTVGVALIHREASGKKEGIAAAIYKVVGGEMLYGEKGFGAFVNKRRVRVSKRGSSEVFICASQDLNFLSKKIAGKKFSHRAYGSPLLELAYVASARMEMTIFSKEHSDLLSPFFVLVREAGGKVLEEENFFVISN
jgi:myo-inositol-1(or 4)-monophosphatase